MNLRPRTPATVLWVGLVLLMAGRPTDLQRYGGPDEFETAGDQLRAHWLAWLGALVLLAVTQILMLVGATFTAGTLGRQRVRVGNS